MSKVKVVFYLPLLDNDGRSLRSEIDQLEVNLYIQFVGWTFLGYVKGAYKMADGSKSLDESAAYSLVVGEERIDEVVKLLQNFKEQTTQEAIYLEINRDTEVRFIT